MYLNKLYNDHFPSISFDETGSCLVGDATFNNDEIYFDGLREKECGMGETACFSTTLEIVATGLNKTFEGICSSCMLLIILFI